MLRKIRVFTKGLDIIDANVVVFAANELRKYLSKLTEKDIMIIEDNDADYSPSSDGISIGVNLSNDLVKVDLPDEEDAILIDVTWEDGLITAVNPRAVLIAVYRYLREIGFAFVRPGKNGEIYPNLIKKDRVYVCEKPDTKLRIVCIEGADFCENTIDFIDWLPKIGMNSLHLQNFMPLMYFKRYFEISPNYHNEPIKLKDEDIAGFNNTLVREIGKRGLYMQNVGHGWTTEALGLPSNTWLESPEPAPEELKQYLALKDGKREYHNGIPMSTNLCYGNEKVRKMLANCVADYCEKNPLMKMVHFWLADAGNTFCECEKCIDHTASDLYVMVLNEIDAELTRRNINVRVATTVYTDTCWPPVKENFNNPNRFIMLFAPITRSYSKTYDPNDIGTVVEYVRNKCHQPKDIPTLLAHMKAWQEWTGSETIIFDYHYMWDHFKVFGYWDTALRINEDIKQFKTLKFDGGHISCQELRVFFPSAFGQHVMAETLWNTDTDFEEAAAKAFKDEFGENSHLVAEFLKTITYLMNPKATRREESMIGEDKAINFEKAQKLASEFRQVAADNVNAHQNDVQKTSWRNIGIYSELCMLMCKCYAALSREKYTPDLQEAVKEFVFAHEWELRYVFDSYEFLKVFLELVDFTLTGVDRCVIY